MSSGIVVKTKSITVSIVTCLFLRFGRFFCDMTHAVWNASMLSTNAIGIVTSTGKEHKKNEIKLLDWTMDSNTSSEYSFSRKYFPSIFQWEYIISIFSRVDRLSSSFLSKPLARCFVKTIAICLHRATQTAKSSMYSPANVVNSQIQGLCQYVNLFVYW